MGGVIRTLCLTGCTWRHVHAVSGRNLARYTCEACGAWGYRTRAGLARGKPIRAYTDPWTDRAPVEQTVCKVEVETRSPRADDPPTAARRWREPSRLRGGR